MGIEMKNMEAGRCLLCKVPKCSAACAVRTDVPAAMKLYREDRIEEAAQMLYENNPFSAVTSLVCDWKKSCYGHCVLNARKMPIDWHSIEAEISIPYLKKVHPRTGIDNGKKVAVIGGGPAGITAALELREKGCAVTVFDKNERPGGVLRYGIPEFRLEREIIDQYDRILAEAGVGFAGGADVNAMKFSEIRREFDAVLIACGASVPRRLDIPGEEHPDIIYALDYLKNPSAYRLKDNVLVIGGGNVTMDACRTAKRAGHDTTVYYRKTFENMPANSMEVQEAINEGIKFCLFEVPVEIRGNKAVMRKCENVVKSDGRIATRMIEGSDHEVEFGSMLVAISANVDYNIFGDEKPEFTNGWLTADEGQQTSLPGVFIAGDYILGPATVVEAVESAKKAVKGISDFLKIQ